MGPYGGPGKRSQFRSAVRSDNRRRLAVGSFAARNDLGELHAFPALDPSGTDTTQLSGKLSVSIRFWRDKGGCLSDETITKLQKAGIRIEVGDRSAYRTDKRPVRMEYLDDISLPEFSHLPTFKRICICILKNDHACKYMGFAPNKNETQRRKKIMEKYESLL